MARLVLLCVALAGCLRSTEYECNSVDQCVAGGDQGVCETTGYCSFTDASCPSGRRYGTLSGPFAAQCVEDSDGDQDDDGVADAADNCPAIANGDQHNEDRDRFGDKCDPCPPVMDDNPADGDDDGVADACDPRPMMGGDRIAVFEGFGAGIPTGWVQGGNGEWLQMGDDLTTHPPDTGGPAFSALSITTNAQTGNETSSGAMTVESIDAVQNSGVSINTNSAGQSAIICFVVRDQQGDNLTVSDFQSDTSMPFALVAAPYRIDLRRDGTMYSCTGDQSGTGATVEGTFPLVNSPYARGISAFGLAARFHWFMVVEN